MISGLAWIPVLCMIGLAIWAFRIGFEHEKRRRLVKPDPDAAREWDRILKTHDTREACAVLEHAQVPERSEPAIAACIDDSLDDREIASVGYGPYA